MAFDASGRLIVAEFSGNRVVRIEPNGAVTLLAGNGKSGYSGDGGPATQAQMDGPFYLAFDSEQRLYISDSLNGRVRRIEPDGTLITVVGGGTREEDGASAHDTRIRRVGGIAFDSQGRLHFADMGAQRVRRVEADGTVHTVAKGSFDVPKGVEPDLQGAGGIAFDAQGNLYVTEYGAARIRKVAPDGTVTTVAGSTRGLSGDGGPALSASFDNPWGIAVRDDGIYVVDASNNRVRRIKTDGIVETVSGAGPPNSSNDGMDAAKAGIVAPCCLTFDARGNLWVNDVRGSIYKISFGPLAPGDLDGDGAVTPSDVRKLLGAVVGKSSLMTTQTQAADLNRDGRLTILDVVRLLKQVCSP
jgi:sugar lactone lactonase YvrE